MIYHTNRIAFLINAKQIVSCHDKLQLCQALMVVKYSRDTVKYPSKKGTVSCWDDQGILGEFLY